MKFGSLLRMMREKTPKSIEEKLLIKNRHCCCICRWRGIGKEINIHHIDGNNSNNGISNLSVLCLEHASMADAGLREGKLGSGKKLSPKEVKEFKAIWEKMNDMEIQESKASIPKNEKRYLEMLYDFEIRKSIAEIASLKEHPKQNEKIEEKFNYFNQLAFEEIMSNIDIRMILLKAYSDYTFNAIGSDKFSEMMAESIYSFSWHLMDPKEVPIFDNDKKVIFKSIEVLESLGTFTAEFNNIPSLKKIGETIEQLGRIIILYNLEDKLNKIFNIISEVKKSCNKYTGFEMIEGREEIIKNDRKERLRIVSNIENKLQNYLKAN
jgi:hypothetical protein